MKVFQRSFCLATLLLLCASGAVIQGQPAPAEVGNQHLAIGLDLGNGITVTSIRDRVTGHEFLKRPASLFEFAVNNGTAYQSDTGVQVTGFTPSPDGTI